MFWSGTSMRVGEEGWSPMTETLNGISATPRSAPHRRLRWVQGQVFGDYVAAFQARWIAIEDSRTRRAINDVNNVGVHTRFCVASPRPARRRALVVIDAAPPAQVVADDALRRFRALRSAHLDVGTTR